MANTSISNLTAGAAVSATDLVPNVQSAGAGPVKTTAAQLKTFMSDSPALVTPTLSSGTANTVPYLDASKVINANISALGFTGNFFTVASATKWNTVYGYTAGSLGLYGFPGSSEAGLTSNIYYSGGFKYIAAGAATIYTQNAAHNFYVYSSGTADAAVSLASTMTFDGVGDLTISGSTATKASGTTWANPSDIRIKKNIQPYTKGIDVLKQIQVKTWQYNGKANTVDGMPGMGVIADEIMLVLPQTVTTYEYKLNPDDKDPVDIKKFDATEITWLLVKTVQDQQATIENLQSRIAVLEKA